MLLVWLKKTDFNSKITEVENKIPSITGLATNFALTAVENEIPYLSSLVKKTDYNTKISEIENKVNDHNHDKYITTPEFNTMAATVQCKISSTNRFKNISDRVTKNKTKHLLVENELKKLQKFHAAYFRGTSHFEDDGTQNYLVFQPIYSYFRRIIGIGNGNYIYF